MSHWACRSTSARIPTSWEPLAQRSLPSITYSAAGFRRLPGRLPQGLRGRVGLDVGATYPKAVILDERNQIAGRGMVNTGFKLDQAAQRAFDQALEAAGVIAYPGSYGG